MSFQAETLAAIPAAPTAAPEAIKAIPYDQKQSVALWTATNAETRADALFLAILPIISGYLVSGSGKADMQEASLPGALAANDVKRTLLSRVIMGGTGKERKDGTRNYSRRDKAAITAFTACLRDYQPRQCRFDQSAHDEAIEALRLDFDSIVCPTPTEKKIAVKRYSVEQMCKGELSVSEQRKVEKAWAKPTEQVQAPAISVKSLCDLIRAGQLSAEDLSAIDNAMADAVNAGQYQAVESIEAQA